MKLMKQVTALFLCFLMLSSSPISAFAQTNVSGNDVVVETTAPTETSEASQDDQSNFIGPQVGDRIWIKSGSYVYKTQSEENGYQLLFNYEVEIANIITDDTGAVIWYEFKFTASGIGESILKDYKYVRVDSTSVEEPAETEPSDENACNCGEYAPENIADHADGCPRKQYVKTLFEGKTAEEIYAEWDNYDEETRTDLLNMLQEYNNAKYEELEKLVEGSSDDEKEETADNIGLELQGVPENVTLSAETVAPKSFHEDLFDVVGNKKIVFAIDITLTDNNAEWQPAEDQSVTVSLDAASLGLSDGERIGILHDHDGTLKNLGAYPVTDGKLTFTTDGFSAFYGYTVDFEYNGRWHSIDGGTNIYLGELFEELGIDYYESDVVEAISSNEALLSVTKIPISDDFGGGYEWLLSSLQSFETEETLTIQFKDGEKIVIAVTDPTTDGNTTTYTNETGDLSGTVNNITIEGTVTLNLTGDVTLRGRITIQDGASLTINGNNHQIAAAATNPLETGNVMFYLEQGTSTSTHASLSLNNCVIDGGAIWTGDEDPYVKRGIENDGRQVSFIHALKYGSVTANHVTFQNAEVVATNESGDSRNKYAVMRFYDGTNVDFTSCTIADCQLAPSNNGMIRVNTAGEEVTFKLTNCEVTGCRTKHGVLRTGSAANVDMTITGSTFQYNDSYDGWGVVLWNSQDGTCTISNTTFDHNHSGHRGGAISNEAKELILNNCMFTNNSAEEYGGAICVFSYQAANSATPTQYDINLTVNDGCRFENNTSQKGGAIAVIVSKSEVEGDQTYFNLTMDINVDPETGSIKNNHATYGGAVYIESTDPASSSTLKLTKGLISGNTATDGGAIYVTNTNVDFGTIQIEENTALNNGGGLYITQSAPTAGSNGTTKIESGNVTNNTATNFGGGIYHTGPNGTCNVSGNGTISNNTAANGGGIYIDDGSELSVTGGIITDNHAIGSSDAATAKEAKCGVGGGIYVNTGEFSMSGDNIGLHSNVASVAANDAYATGGTATKLTLPDVEGMNLVGWSGTGKPTGWFADYKVGDPNYPSDVIQADGEATTNPGRYDYYDKDKVEVDYFTVLKTNTNTYYCLTIGTPHTGHGDLLITKTLTAPAEEDQTYIFEVTGTTREPESTYSLTVTLTIKEGDTVAQVLVANIPDGTYTVTEKQAWSWRYNQTSCEFHPKDGAVISETTFTVAIENPEWVAEFTNSRTDQFWLSGDSYCENWWGGSDGTKVEKREEHD